MTISYNWLCEYLPETIDPDQLSAILTAIGLEVEHMEKTESIKGGLKGLVVGEVMTCEKHPEADKLKLTTVNTGGERPLNIVCGAPNVAVGQKVIVAPIGTTIYPLHGEPMTMKKAKIRGAESEGMICAEDEIGLGESHEGIKLLPGDLTPGTPVSTFFDTATDFIYEIGLTPNRMDAMSHLGVAKDVCAWLSYHKQKPYAVRSPFTTHQQSFPGTNDIAIEIKNEKACLRYTGILIKGVTVKESPDWLKKRLTAIGQKPINNIVDITNFILHETGQPLHAFDADKIAGKKVIITTVDEGTSFITLDEKERKLKADDLMICHAMEPMCIAGVYGGLHSGVVQTTQNIFLESACFDKGFVRKTAMHHELRTDAATRFEKGVDISNTLTVALRAAHLIASLSGGEIVGDVTDVYPNPHPKTSIDFEYEYLKKLSGKVYNSDAVFAILNALGFEITAESGTGLELKVPYSKPDISIQADIVEEIMRIDGLDNIEIPQSINIAPSVEKSNYRFQLKEKIAGYLTGNGFHEIFTNSITNSAFYDETVMSSSVRMINSLSSELNMLRPEMMRSGLQVISHNINRKNSDLRLYEFGKTYTKDEAGTYNEKLHLSIYITGNISETFWNSKSVKADFFYLKGIAETVLGMGSVKKYKTERLSNREFTACIGYQMGKKTLLTIGQLDPKLLKQFDIKQPVFFADLDMDMMLDMKSKPVQYSEISKFPAVHRDLALVVDKNVSYSQIEQIALSLQIGHLKQVQLFDIFESEKLGAGKKSMAVSFTFLDDSKTLTDKEIDGFMSKIILGYENNIQAEIRK